MLSPSSFLHKRNRLINVSIPVTTVTKSLPKKTASNATKVVRYLELAVDLTFTKDSVTRFFEFSKPMGLEHLDLLGLTRKLQDDDTAT